VKALEHDGANVHPRMRAAGRREVNGEPKQRPDRHARHDGRMLRNAVIVASTLFAGCTFQVHLTRLGAGAEHVATALDAAWNAHFAAVRREDAAAACALYADDVCYEIAGQTPLRGPAAVEAMEAAGMQASDVGDDLAHVSLAVSVHGAVAHELGTVAGSVGAVGEPKRRVGFDYVAVWRQGGDGTWRITQLIGQLAGEPRPAR
jgi:ketosteroid isomerase-like protein